MIVSKKQTANNNNSKSNSKKKGEALKSFFGNLTFLD